MAWGHGGRGPGKSLRRGFGLLKWARELGGIDTKPRFGGFPDNFSKKWAKGGVFFFEYNPCFLQGSPVAFSKKVQVRV